MAYKKSNANGQATMANSEPVVIASDQSAVPVSATDLDIRNLTNTDVVTAELSATDNAVLDAIAASVAAIDTDATTIIGHVDGIETAIASTNTKLDTIITNTADTETAVDGLETAVASTNTKLDTVIGHVDGLETSNTAIQTAVQLIDDTVQVLGTDTYTEATSKGITLGAVRRDADTTLVNTTNEFGPLQMDANGRLKTEVFSGEALPVTDNGASLSVDWNGTQPVTGSGNATGALRVELPTNGTGVIATVTNITNQGQIADDGTFTPATTRVNMAGFFADETATDSVDEGDGGAARMTLDRKQIITPYVHAAAGGWTPYKSLDLDESEEEIKASAGKIGWIHCMNMSASVRYLKFYNATAANVTVGTTTPVLTFPIPTLATTNGAGFTISFGDAGLQFGTAICVAATTGLADNDTGAPGANEVVLNVGYL
jgi:DNA-binding FrmR family transcriptional regulator